MVLIRPRAFADETSFYINVNRDDIAPIRSGQHTRLKLPAGEHRVAIRCYSALSGVEPLSESEGSELLSRTVLMKVLH